MSGMVDWPYQRKCAESDARRVPGEKPYCLVNDLGRETIPGVADLVHPRWGTRPPRTPQAQSAVTMPHKAVPAESMHSCRPVDDHLRPHEFAQPGRTIFVRPGRIDRLLAVRFFRLVRRFRQQPDGPPQHCLHLSVERREFPRRRPGAGRRLRLATPPTANIRVRSARTSAISRSTA